MKKLSDMPKAQAAGVRLVLTDIDDTITDDGRLHAGAYAALEKLHEGGFKVIPVTGRPAGWCDMIARFWPVDAIVGENGALYMRYDRAARRMTRRFWLDDAERMAAKARLQALGRRILDSVPGTALASDQAYRECDLAIDYCEDVPPLDGRAVQAIVDAFTSAGAVAKVSSIHVNGWFGHWDKLLMTRRLFADVYGLDLDRVRDQVVFAGDSPNDQPMFGHFPLSVGVANVARFARDLTSPPTYITPSEGGHGFTELTEALLAARLK